MLQDVYANESGNWIAEFDAWGSLFWQPTSFLINEVPVIWSGFNLDGMLSEEGDIPTFDVAIRSQFQTNEVFGKVIETQPVSTHVMTA